MDAVGAYHLDPVATMNKGLASYPGEAASDRQRRYLSKLPGIAYPEPKIQQMRSMQADGPFNFEQLAQRQRASCTRPQLDIMPDRIATELYPIPASAAMTVEPFERQGGNARYMAKDGLSRSACWVGRRRS